MSSATQSSSEKHQPKGGVGDAMLPPGSAQDALAITKRAKSNLAFALARMPKERRRDMITFYAYCRVIDDIADCEVTANDEKREQLQRWREVLHGEREAATGSLEAGTLEICAKYEISVEHMLGIIDGVSMDLSPRRYGTPEDLENYCYHVASLVGLVSIEMFGYENAQCREFAVQLGYALQWTNIIRDVATDSRNGGRIYLPEIDLHRFQLTDADILGGAQDGRFQNLMEFEYQRAVGYYDKAMELLPAEDEKSMHPGLVMARIYRELLEKIRADGFRVFDKDYRLSRCRKLWLLLTT